MEPTGFILMMKIKTWDLVEKIFVSGCWFRVSAVVIDR